MINPGEKLPIDIQLKDINNNLRSIEDFLNQKYLVVYFYPHDDTRDCILEACSFRDYNVKLKEYETEIIGISADTVESHKEFAKTHKINFDLLSDSKRKLMSKCGVVRLGGILGNNFIGIKRTTFLINREGIIIKRWENVKNLEKHPIEIYEFIKNYEIQDFLKNTNAKEG
jgi:peroxiredoxin Q/BCP